MASLAARGLLLRQAGLVARRRGQLALAPLGRHAMTAAAAAALRMPRTVSAASTVPVQRCQHMGTSSEQDPVSSRVSDAISGHKIVIFSKTTCPYCRHAKLLMRKKHVEAYVVELDESDVKIDGEKVEPDSVRNVLKKEYNHNTLPAVFINGEFVGGASDLDALDNSGELDKRIK